jgi:hypothetical protein
VVKLLVLTIAILIIHTYLAITFVSLGKSDFCNDKIIKELSVHGYENKVVAYIRDCGATTSFSPQVAFIKTNKKNVDIEDDLIFVANHSDFVDISWKSTSTLLIAYDVKKDDIIKQEKKWGKIFIEYRKK